MDGDGQVLSEVGGFQLRTLIGRGAMGEVYRAFDPRTQRLVAVKLMSGRGDLGRFVREAQLTATVNHPGVVRVHDAGIARGRAYIVYELLEDARGFGEVLGERDLAGRCDLIVQTARAVGAAHAQGVVHRDLKPENLLVDGAGRVRVLDFGVALAANLERLTTTGALVGTPGFMAFEQIRGDKGAISPATDVWALGALLFLALTDRGPYSHCRSVVEYYAAVGTADPVSPRSLNPRVPPAVARVCSQALRRDPLQRFANGEAFADALTAALEGSPPARDLPLGQVAAVGGVLLAVAAGITAALGSGLPSTPGTPATVGSAATPRAAAAVPDSDHSTAAVRPPREPRLWDLGAGDSLRFRAGTETSSGGRSLTWEMVIAQRLVSRSGDQASFVLDVQEVRLGGSQDSIPILDYDSSDPAAQTRFVALHQTVGRLLKSEPLADVDLKTGELLSLRRVPRLRPRGKGQTLELVRLILGTISNQGLAACLRTAWGVGPLGASAGSWTRASRVWVSTGLHYPIELRLVPDADRVAISGRARARAAVLSSRRDAQQYAVGGLELSGSARYSARGLEACQQEMRYSVVRGNLPGPRLVSVTFERLDVE